MFFFLRRLFNLKKNFFCISLSLSYYLAAPPFEHKHKYLSLPHRKRTIFYFFISIVGEEWVVLAPS